MCGTPSHLVFVVIVHVLFKERRETFVDVILVEAPDWPFDRDLHFASTFVKLQCAHTKVFSHSELEFEVV